MDEAYGQKYRELYEKHWWWRARENLILSTIARIQRQKVSSRSILDVGCGDGLLFDRLKDLGDVEGIEMNPSLVSSNSRWRDSIYICPFDDKFNPGKQYSLILMLDVLEHFRDPLRCLRRALELLQPEGTLLVTVPAFPCLWTSHDDLNHHFKRYTKRSLIELTRQAGMRPDACRYFFQWTFPVKLLIRFKEKLNHIDPKPPNTPPYWINMFLYWLSSLEQKLFTVVPMPFGSSLILLGGKQGTEKPSRHSVL